MRNLTIITACLSLLLCVACGDLDQDHSAAPGATTQSACKPSTKADGLSAGTVKAEASGGTVTVHHLDAYYNCASKLQLQVTVSQSEILIQEVITNPGELARCMCRYDLSVPVAGLAPGPYKVTVQDIEGKGVGSTSVTVGNSPVTITSVQSACKAPPAKTYGASGAVKVTVAGGQVTILHEDAYYNCAHKVTMKVSVAPGTLVAQEVITNPNDGAYCMCHYDLSAVVKNVASGAHVVKVIDADGKLVDMVKILIP